MKPRQNIPAPRVVEQKQSQPFGSSQRNSAVLPARKSPAAPPVYRAQPASPVMQSKVALAQPSQRKSEIQARRAPSAPPAYRPQSLPKVLQAKKSIDNRATVIGQAANNRTSRKNAPVQVAGAPRRVEPLQARTVQRKQSSSVAIARSTVVRPAPVRPGPIIQAAHHNPYAYAPQNPYAQQNPYNPYALQNPHATQNPQNLFHFQSLPPVHGHQHNPQQNPYYQQQQQQQEEAQAKAVVKSLQSAKRLAWRVGDTRELEHEIDQYAYAEYRKIKAEKEAYLELELNNRHKTAWENIVSGLAFAVEWNDPDKANSTIAITGSWHYRRYRANSQEWRKFRTDAPTAVGVLNDLARTALNVYIGNARVNKGQGSMTDFHDIHDPMGLMKQPSGDRTPFSSALARIPTHSILTGLSNMSEQQYQDLHEASLTHYHDLYWMADKRNDVPAKKFFADKYHAVKNTQWFQQ